MGRNGRLPQLCRQIDVQFIAMMLKVCLGIDFEEVGHRHEGVNKRKDS